MGPAVVGPVDKVDLKGAGSKVTVNEDYIKESILEPQKKVRAGFQPVMSTYKGLVSEEGPGNDIDALTEYIKTLK